MTEAKPSSPVANIQRHGGTLVRPANHPSRAELAESIEVLHESLDEACRKLMEPVRIDYIEDSPHLRQRRALGHHPS
ncbi:MAG: hypothetical protein OXN89_09315 [Bryobacterales bacterium]|nr:hypothetical protein [Bryobacterales bacterium]